MAIGEIFEEGELVTLTAEKKEALKRALSQKLAGMADHEGFDR
jgi:hypothetical protein